LFDQNAQKLSNVGPPVQTRGSKNNNILKRLLQTSIRQTMLQPYTPKIQHIKSNSCHSEQPADALIMPFSHAVNFLPSLHQFVPISPHATFISPLSASAPSPYNPNFCFFTLGNTPMSTIPAVTMTAHNCILSVPLLKSVCVAAATVVKLSTSSTYPLIR